jgi:hypothetical protein
VRPPDREVRRVPRGIGTARCHPQAYFLTAEMFLAALRPLRVLASVAEARAYLVATARTVLAGYWRRRLGREGRPRHPSLPPCPGGW